MSSNPLSEKSRPRTVLVAYEPNEVGQQVVTSVERLGHHTESASDGDQAWALLRSHPYDLLVVDAAISGKPSYELCDAVISANLETKIILVASVYRKTRYKRRPSSLYGADDYVEQHHIHDKLPEKICALFGGHPSYDEESQVDPERIRREGDRRLEDGKSALKSKVRLARLARIVASDMALYNPELIKRAPARFTEQEHQDLAHGRSFLLKMLPGSEVDARELLLEALSFLRRHGTHTPLRREG